MDSCSLNYSMTGNIFRLMNISVSLQFHFYLETHTSVFAITVQELDEGFAQCRSFFGCRCNV